MARLVFLLEEPSMRNCLEVLLPRCVDGLIYRQNFLLIPHEGKQDLEKSIPIKLRAWRYPDDEFIIVRDQDSGDCRQIKANLLALCTKAGKNPLLVRIACHELESWYLGDLAAVGRAYDMPKLHTRQNTKKFKNPDRLITPSREMADIVPGFGKTSGAGRIAQELSITDNTSTSYKAFVSGIQKVAHKVI